jgi:hypothetical protein
VGGTHAVACEDTANLTRGWLTGGLVAKPHVVHTATAHLNPNPKATTSVDTGTQDFYSRHLTLGDVGCSLSHLALWEQHARAPDDAILVVLEDDARPETDAVSHLLAQATSLSAAGVRWEVLYGHGTLYSHRAEARVPGTECVWAGHRKVTDFYLITGLGARKLAGCGFRRSVLPVDDFLPAVQVASTHPRPDVMALACVRAVRDGGDGGLLALALAPGAERCASACKTAGSASKHTPCLLGDLGAQVEDDARDDPAHTDEPQNTMRGWVGGVGGVDGGGGGDEESRVDVGDAAALAGVLAQQMARGGGGWASGLAHAQLVAAQLVAERAWWDFFAEEGQGEEHKRRCTGSGGRGGPTQRLMLWGNGWTKQRSREQFHTVVGAADAQVRARASWCVPSTRWHPVPGAHAVGLRVRRRGLGFVHHSRAIFCRAVPRLRVTFRNCCIAVPRRH